MFVSFGRWRSRDSGAAPAWYCGVRGRRSARAPARLVRAAARSPRRRHAKRDRNQDDREDHEPVVPPREPDQNISAQLASLLRRRRRPHNGVARGPGRRPDPADEQHRPGPAALRPPLSSPHHRTTAPRPRLARARPPPLPPARQRARACVFLLCFSAFRSVARRACPLETYNILPA